jgi:sugar/nucleoside kinase (ribokinase family)
MADLVPAYQTIGSVNSVGAGDSFLAGVIAALCHFSETGADGTSLAELLRCGAASSLHRVDTGRAGKCPELSALVGELMGLETLPLGNAALCGLQNK